MTATHPINHAQIVIIGAGVAGISTAYFLTQAGYDVAVLERRSNVAEEGTLCNSGLVIPGSGAPLSLPGIAATGFGSRLRRISPTLTTTWPSLSRWGWHRRSRGEEALSHDTNKAILTSISRHGSHLIKQLQLQHKLEDENIEGLLRVFRKQEDADRTTRDGIILEREDIKSSSIPLEHLKNIEPALLSPPALAEARYYPEDMAGNCVLFTKQLKHLAQSLGAVFHFSENVKSIQQQGTSIRLDTESGSFTADAVILCCGMQSAAMLKPLGMHLPLMPVESYMAVAPLKTIEYAPQGTVYDETYRVAISRLGNRLRVSGLLGFLPHTEVPHPKAVRTLLHIASEYFPNAVNYNHINVLGRSFALAPNGMPYLAMASSSNIFVNTAHGVHGWASAVATSQLLTDYILGRPTAIDTTAFFHKL